MPLDGIVLSNIAKEISESVLNSRIDKIHQPERDEIVLWLRSQRLLLSANPSNPRACFVYETAENPMQAPLFCMVLRKHLAGGKIVAINQPGFERILEISVEHLNEMGDPAIKRLIIEIMGKHSNIILLDEAGVILDAIKKVSLDKSSVRQVLPGHDYVYPPAHGKIDPRSATKELFIEKLQNSLTLKTQEAIYKSYSGISPLSASEICLRANINPSDFVEIIDSKALYSAFNKTFTDIEKGSYCAKIYFENSGAIKDFSAIDLTMWAGLKYEYYESISKLINDFYRQKDSYYKKNQKTHDLKKLVSNLIERLSKKKELLKNSLEDVKTRDEIKVLGELITANIYAIKQGQSSAKVINFYDENSPEVEIALDAALSPAENAQKYFKKYNKQKRTFEAANIQLTATDEDLYYLESILNSLETNLTIHDIEDIRSELREQGFIKKSPATLAKKKAQPVKKSVPMRFLSTDGFEIYVGKSNKQNDELTMEFASSGDLWLHTKNIPGSHVIIKTEGAALPEQTIEEAAHLAAFFSKGRSGSLVPVDYTLRKNIKKPKGSKPGMVIYTSNSTAYITPSQAVIDTINKYNEVY